MDKLVVFHANQTSMSCICCCIPIRHCSHIMGRFLGLPLAGIYYHNNEGSGENAIAHLISDVPMIRPQGYKTFFMLNSTVHDILTAHKN